MNPGGPRTTPPGFGTLTHIDLRTDRGSHRWGEPRFHHTHGPDFPVADVAYGPDFGVRASVAASFPGSLYWTYTDESRQRLLISDDIVEVVKSRQAATTLNEPWLRGFHLREGDLDPFGTPYAEVNRLPPGSRAHFPAGAQEPSITMWHEREGYPTPTLEGPVAQATYLQTFDDVVAGLVGDGPVCATLSGGLDSSFVVASLARNPRVKEPIHAFCHSPHPEAGLADSNKVADDYPAAQAMERAYPGRVIVHRVLPEPGENALDAAVAFADRSWLPAFNVSNIGWIGAICQRTRELGGERLFVGAKGNFAFSASHEYAPEYYLARGQLVRAWRSASRDSPRSALELATAPLRARLRRGLRSLPGTKAAPDDYFAYLGLTSHGGYRMPVSDRARFLQSLTPGRNAPTGGAVNWGVPMVDPFASAQMIAVAAAITPREWSKGPHPRGYARLLAEGRVPDEIRLRTRRGSQALDQWFLMRNMRDRYYDELALLPETPILGGWLDFDYLRSTLDSFGWGEVTAPPTVAVIAVNRLLSLATFIRSSQKRLRELSDTRNRGTLSRGSQLHSAS